MKVILLIDLVKSLYRKYGTANPFLIAQGLKIKVLTVPLEGVRGYYHYFRRNHFIYLADSLEEPQRTFICAHELGHYFLHSRINTVIMDRYTFCPKNKFENEANGFAVALLTYDLDSFEYEDLPRDRILLRLGVPLEIVHRL